MFLLSLFEIKTYSNNTITLLRFKWFLLAIFWPGCCWVKPGKHIWSNHSLSVLAYVDYEIQFHTIINYQKAKTKQIFQIKLKLWKVTLVSYKVPLVKVVSKFLDLEQPSHSGSWELSRDVDFKSYDSPVSVAIAENSGTKSTFVGGIQIEAYRIKSSLMVSAIEICGLFRKGVGQSKILPKANSQTN